MGQPAVVTGDAITWTCVGHQIPSPSGAPVPAPPLPFNAPITRGCDASVLIQGSPAAVEMAEGSNATAHVGLHVTDPHLAPNLQSGLVVKGSSTVLIGGRGAAYTGCRVTACFQAQASVVGSAASVLVGG